MTSFTPAGLPWTRKEIISSLDEFMEIYKKRPIQDNNGGMKAPHMFATWFICRQLQPDIIIESGIWYGQSTWLFEQACPEAELFSIDINLANRKYISKRSTYLDTDFSCNNWNFITNHSLAFFDDHQNALNRLRQCEALGLKHIIFEDNYPHPKGDCYSLKKALGGFGHEHELIKSLKAELKKNSNNVQLQSRLSALQQTTVEANSYDRDYINTQLDILDEFPPVVQTAMTRWGDRWDSSVYPTEEPLLVGKIPEKYQIFIEEANSYNWLCYARLR